MHRHRVHLIVAGLVLSSFACSLQKTPQATQPEAEAATPTPEAVAVAPVSLDPCTLLSAEEVSNALGETVEVQPGLQTGACSFATTTGSQPKSIGVSAAQGSQARELVQMSASMGLLFGGTPELQQVADDLKANAASMTLVEVVEKAHLLLAPLGYGYSPAENQTSPSFWGWNPMGAGSLEQVDGETYLAISAIGLEEPSAKTLTKALLDLAASRLPAAFTIELGESLRIQYTAEVPTVTPEATSPPQPAALSTVWVADRSAGHVAHIDCVTGRILADVRVGAHPSSIAAGEDAVWVANEGDGSVSRIDPATHEVVATIPIGKSGFLRLAQGEGRVWVAACLDKVVKVIDPATNQVTASVPAEGCWNVAVGGGQVWVPTGERTVTRIDPVSLVAIPTVFVQSGPSEIASGFDSMWVANVNAMTVSRFDPVSREVTATLMTGLDHANHSIRGLAAAADRVWLATTAGILGFDPADNTLATLHTTVADPWFLAPAGGALWVTTNAPGGIFALDPTSGELVRQVSWGSMPSAISAGP